MLKNITFFISTDEKKGEKKQLRFFLAFCLLSFKERKAFCTLCLSYVNLLLKICMFHRFEVFSSESFFVFNPLRNGDKSIVLFKTINIFLQWKFIRKKKRIIELTWHENLDTNTWVLACQKSYCIRKEWLMTWTLTFNWFFP